MQFVEAPSALTYALTCQAWSIDPAEEIEDPWLKHQLRLGLLRVIRKHEEKPEVDEDGNEVNKDLERHKAKMKSTRHKLSQMGY